MVERYRPSCDAITCDREYTNQLAAHDADYRASKKDWDTFVETLTEKIVEKDETIPELPAKDLVSPAPVPWPTVHENLMTVRFSASIGMSDSVMIPLPIR